jgi:hypothetical protein
MRVADKVPYFVKDAAGALVEKEFTLGDYNIAFITAGVMCLVAAVLTLALRAPAPRERAV